MLSGTRRCHVEKWRRLHARASASTACARPDCRNLRRWLSRTACFGRLKGVRWLTKTRVKHALVDGCSHCSHQVQGAKEPLSTVMDGPTKPKSQNIIRNDFSSAMLSKVRAKPNKVLPSRHREGTQRTNFVAFVSSRRCKQLF